MIVGMGGLGHMGVKIAHAMGAEVTVLSQTLNKEQTVASSGRPLLRDQRQEHVQGVARAL